MSSQITIDQLLKPISQELSTGSDLREDLSVSSIYFQIKDARTQARNLERKIQQGEENLDPMSCWKKVNELALKILLDESKDLEVVAWFIEAEVRMKGVDGLLFGFQLMFKLIENCWESLFPREDDSEIDSRLAAFAGLNGIDVDGTLIQPILSISITRAPAIPMWEYIAKSTPPEKINQAVLDSGSDFYQNLIEKTEQAIKSYSGLVRMIDEKCQDRAPPTSQILNTLNKFKEQLHFLINDSPFNLTPEKVIEISKDAEPSHSKQTQILLSRQEALNTLMQIAEFFKQNEPHSPIPYLLDRAVRWGALSFPELLEEMVVDQAARKAVGDLSGIVS